ncbi:MAG: hypothetical protein J5850_04480 [Clostridia bacterium]|nr:hypothetical protein [Clostridia bacterium]
MIKLLKYDLKALLRIIVPIDATILVAALIGCGSLVALFGVASSDVNSEVMDFLSIFVSFGSSMTLMFSMILISMAIVVAQIIIFVRYYKNMITDEAYLTFTLPRTSGQIFASKFISGFISLAITAVIVLIGYSLVGLTFAYLTASQAGIGLSEFISDSFKLISGMIKSLTESEMFNVSPVWFIIVAVLFLLTAASKQLLLPYTCMNVGGCVAKKHKLLCAIGIYFGFSFVSTLAYEVINFFVTILLSQSESFYASDLLITFTIYTFIEIAITVILWLISHFVLKKKLNLQ